MSRVGVTKKNVTEAAHSIALEGIAPTILNVREFLGKGSNSTISRLLKEWRCELVTKQSNGADTNCQSEDVLDLEEKIAKLLAEQEKILFELKSQLEENTELKNKVESLEDENAGLKKEGRVQKAELEKYHCLYIDLKSQRQAFEQEKIEGLNFEKENLKEELKCLYERFDRELSDIREVTEKYRVEAMMAKYKLGKCEQKLKIAIKRKEGASLDPIALHSKLNEITETLYFLCDKKMQGDGDE